MTSNGLIVDPNVNLVVATEPCGERDLDDTVGGGWSWFNHVRNDSGAGASVNHTTP